MTLQVLGHRGCIDPSHTPCENSLKAFAVALTHADGLECDVCRSSDGVLFLVHEAIYADPAAGVQYVAAKHLDAPSSQRMATRKLEDMRAQEVRQLRLKDGQPIPALEDLMPFFKGTQKIMMLELKGYDVADLLAAKLSSAFAQGDLFPQQVVIVSFYHPALERIKTVLPEVKIGASFVRSIQPPTLIFPWRDVPDAMYCPFTTQTACTPLVVRLAPDYFVIPHHELGSPAMNGYLDRLGKLQFIVWRFTETLPVATGDASEDALFMDNVKKYYAAGVLKTIIIDSPQAAQTYKSAVKKACVATHKPMI